MRHLEMQDLGFTEPKMSPYLHTQSIIGQNHEFEF